MGTSFVIGLAVVSGLTMPALFAPEPLPNGGKVDAARLFVKSLSDAERSKALLPLDHPERTKWFFARGEREGLFLRDMDSDTRQAALALVDSMLSDAGREQWRLIREVEAINAARERESGVTPPTYGDDLYVARLGRLKSRGITLCSMRPSLMELPQRHRCSQVRFLLRLVKEPTRARVRLARRWKSRSNLRVLSTMHNA